MLISKNFLSSIVPQFKNISDADIDKATYNLGMVLEQVIKHPKLDDNIYVGKVLNVEKIKGSSKLHYATVEVNNKQYKIVCGANNFKKNNLVAVALPGAKLYDGVVINEKEILGYKSQGMLCGYNELTPYGHDYLDYNDKNGIVILDKDAKVGTQTVAKELGLDDTIYDLTLPSDRPDWMGSILIIKDLANWFGYKFNIKQAISKLKVFGNHFCKIDENFSSFASYLKIDNVNLKKFSPWKLKKFLINNGCKCENKVIDLITHITYLTGVAPLVFDANNLSDGIIEKHADNNQKITYNNKTYTLSSSDVVLTNTKNEIIGIDGVCVDDKFTPNFNTKSIGLYISNLTHWLPRKSAMTYNITTQASKFAIKPTSLFQINLFIKYIEKKFKNVFITNLCNEIEQQKEIPFNIKECIDFIKPIDVKKFKSTLRSLGFKVLKTSAIVPGYRRDLSNQYDLCEEVIKKLSIDVIDIQPIETTIDVTFDNKDEFYYLTKLRKIMTNNFFVETKTYNLVSKESIERWNVFNIKPMYELHPCSNNEHRFMKLSLLDNMIKVIEYNLNRKNNLYPIFELQKIYNKKNEWNLTCISTAKYLIDPTHNSYINLDTFGLKSILKQIESFFNIELILEKASNSCFAKQDCLSIKYKNEIIGYLGCLNQKSLKPYKITQELYSLVLNIQPLMNNISTKELKIKPLFVTLPVLKDITFLASKDTNIEMINNELKSLDFLVDYKYISAYKNENIDTISYTIHLIINNNESLKKEDIDNFINVIVNIIRKHNGDLKGF